MQRATGTIVGRAISLCWGRGIGAVCATVLRGAEMQRRCYRAADMQAKGTKARYKGVEPAHNARVATYAEAVRASRARYAGELAGRSSERSMAIEKRRVARAERERVWNTYMTDLRGALSSGDAKALSGSKSSAARARKAASPKPETQFLSVREAIRIAERAEEEGTAGNDAICTADTVPSSPSPPKRKTAAQCEANRERTLADQAARRLAATEMLRRKLEAEPPITLATLAAAVDRAIANPVSYDIAPQAMVDRALAFRSQLATLHSTIRKNIRADHGI